MSFVMNAKIKAADYGTNHALHADKPLRILPHLYIHYLTTLVMQAGAEEHCRMLLEGGIALTSCKISPTHKVFT